MLPSLTLYSKKLYLTFILLIGAWSSFGQFRPHSQYNLANNGITGNDIYSIITDTLGYTWFATDKGICRYNGKTIEKMVQLDSVADLENINMYYDGNDHVYFLGYRGRLARIDIRTLFAENITEGKIKEPDEKKKLPALYAYQNKAGSIILMKSGYYITLDNTGDVKLATLPIFKTAFFPRTLHNFNENAANANIKCFTCESIPEAGLPPDFVIRENRASKYNSFITGNKIVYRKNNELHLLYDGDKYNMPLPVMNFCISGNDLYIPCFGNNGYLLKYVNYLGAYGFKTVDTIFKGNYFTDVAFDKTGQLWLGTIGSGVFMIKPTDRYISNVTALPSENEAINNITFLNGAPVLNTSAGLYTTRKNNTPVKISSLNNNNGIAQPVRFITAAKGLVLNAGDKYLEQVYPPRGPAYPLVKQLVTPISTSQNSSFKDYILSADSLHLIFCGGGNIYFSDLSYNRLKRELVFPENKILCMDILNDSMLCLGTSFGVKLYNTSLKKATKLCADDEIITGLGLAQGSVWYTYKDRLETWHYTGGIDDKKITAIRSFLHDQLIRIQKTDNGIVISGKRRLVFIYKSGNQDPLFFDLDQTSVEGILTAATVYNKQLWIATGNKLYNIAALPDNPGNVYATISGISVNGIPVNNNADFKLLYSKNYTIRIGVDIFGPENNVEKKYRVFSKGKSGNILWKPLEGNNFTIDFLNPGSYQWEINVSNNITGKSQLFSGNFTIEPLWYQTIFFQLFLSIVCFGAFLLIYNYRQTLITRQLKQQKKHVETEQHFLLSQMNPHFMHNALSAIQAEILEGKSKLANHYLSKYAELTRLILENSRSTLVPVYKAIRVLDNYLLLQKIRFGNKFDYSLEIYDNWDNDEALMPPMLMQPFAENVFEHGFNGIEYKGQLVVTIQKKEDELVVFMQDNGKGLKKDTVEKDKKKSLSTLITEERLKLLAKETKRPAGLSVHENINKPGVTIIITIPLQHDT